MFFKSIRFTLTLWYSLTLAVILLLFCSLLYLSFRNSLYSEVDGDLLSVAESLSSSTLAPFRDSAPSALSQVLEDFIGPKAKDKYIQIVDRSGEVDAYSNNLQDFRLRMDKSDLRRAYSGKITYRADIRQGARPPLRVIVYPIFEEGRLTDIIQVGASLEDAADTLDKIFLILVVSVPTAILLLTCGGWFLAGRALKPVELITGAARKINAENLNQRIEVVNPNDEIGRLAETFNNTLSRLESSFRKIRQFSSDVSHELRTPLTILRGETEVALRWAKEPDEFREIFESNLEEIRRMSGILEFLLDLSKADEGKLPLNLGDVELNDLLAGLVQQTAVLARENDVKLVFEPHPEVTVLGDRSRLHQLFLNLIDNALKYTEAGGAVWIEISSLDGQARVAVNDTGAGIPPEDIPNIFDRFYRVDKARNRADGGVGLGLAMAKSLAEAHGGRIEVASQLGKGSVFIVYLPLAPAV